MEFPKLLISLLILEALFISQIPVQAAQTDSNLFREYIGSQFNNLKFTDVPINPNVEFHFILSFAIDYDTSSSPSPTNGNFNIFWDSDNLSPSEVSSIKNAHPNVKVALSLGGATVKDHPVYFAPSSVESWVANAVSSLTSIIELYHLDGIDIDYEKFNADADPNTFAECIGRLITTLKNNRVISFASIAPFDEVQSHYLALWSNYGNNIDYVNFQFYTYDQGITVSQFISYFNTQLSKYNGGKVLVSFTTDGNGGLSPNNVFFTACNMLKSQQQLYGIFVWSADYSKANGFTYEEQSQALLAN